MMRCHRRTKSLNLLFFVIDIRGFSCVCVCELQWIFNLWHPECVPAIFFLYNLKKNCHKVSPNLFLIITCMSYRLVDYIYPFDQQKKNSPKFCSICQISFSNFGPEVWVHTQIQDVTKILRRYGFFFVFFMKYGTDVDNGVQRFE